MKQNAITRSAVTAIVVLIATAMAAPAGAQEEVGDRYTILVPPAAPLEGARKNFGEDVAEELRKAIENLHRHQPVSERELRSARRKYSIDEASLYNCITAKQLAMQMNWQLVLCTSYAPAAAGQFTVRAEIAPTVADVAAFDIPEFTVSERDSKGAAQKIIQEFDRWQTQLSNTHYCQQYIDSQQWDSALRTCEQALAINPSSEPALYKKAYTLWKLGRRDEALNTMDVLLEHNPIHQDALKLGGIVATEAKKPEAARAYLDRYMELNPGDVAVRLTIATEIANAGDPEGALRFAQQGGQLDTTNLDMITYIGHFAVNAAILAEARAAGGNGQAAADQEKIREFYQTAANAYEKVFNAKGTEVEPEILERLIIAQFKLGQVDEAVALGARAVVAKPDNAAIWNAYSRALEAGGKNTEALAAIDKVEALGTSDASLSARKANLFLRTGQSERAVQVLRQAVQQGQMPASDAFRIVFVFAFQEKYRKEQWNDAFAIFSAAEPLATAEPDRLALNFWRGYILYQQGQRAHAPMTAESAKTALPLFQRAIELLQAARGYERIEPSADVPKVIDATQRFIEIQEALIKRGR